jgi:hypothetical protein
MQAIQVVLHLAESIKIRPLNLGVANLPASLQATPCFVIEVAVGERLLEHLPKVTAGENPLDQQVID